MALALLRAGTVGPDAGWEGVLWAVGRAAAVALPLLALMAGYRRLRGRDGLGLGDIKLAAVLGAWLGWATIFAVLELATLAAIAAYLVHAFVASAAAARHGLPAVRLVPGARHLARLARRGAAELERFRRIGYGSRAENAAAHCSRLGTHSSACSRACAISPRVILVVTASRIRARASRALGGAAAVARLSHLLASTMSCGTPRPRS